MTHLLLAIIYLAFISLGLPDSLLGSAWPSMYGELGVPVSYAGAISAIISAGTIFSSLQCDRLTRRLGTGALTALSVLTTAAALFGFSVSRSYAALCLWAIPYGLGAGSVDASLNNYVALHYASRHMSWLHCMWGLGASVGPYVMGFALSGGMGWSAGYRYIALFQAALTAVLLISLPLWKKRGAALPEADSDGAEALSLRETARVRGAKETMAAFFCYCAIEQTAGLWAGSYLVLRWGMAEERAASLAGMFFIGITIGRALSGFLTMRLSDTGMVRLGQALILLGAAAMLLPAEGAAVPGLLLVGLGCAPVYPSMIHATPERFGAAHSQSLIGVQMASASVGTCVMPPLFGLIANHISASLLPLYLLAALACMVFVHERLIRKSAAGRRAAPPA